MGGDSSSGVENSAIVTGGHGRGGGRGRGCDHDSGGGRGHEDKDDIIVLIMVETIIHLISAETSLVNLSSSDC